MQLFQATEMAEEDVFVDARDWEKEIEEVKTELESTKREVTKVNKKAISWEREAKDKDGNSIETENS